MLFLIDHDTDDYTSEATEDSKKEKKFVKDVVRRGQELKENTSKAFTESVRTKIES